MNSIKHPRVFDPLDLEIIDRVYETAWAQVEAREPFRDRGRDGEREEALRKLIFAFAGTGRVDFDNLCDSVLANMPELVEVGRLVGVALTAAARQVAIRELDGPRPRGRLG